jgi:hypothetical protein
MRSSCAPVADRVVPHPARRDAGPLGSVRCLPLVLVVGPLQQHGRGAAEVGVDDLYPRVAAGDAVGLELFAGSGAEAALGSGVGVAEIDQQVEVSSVQ